jgi:uncharacterized protein (TIGR00251 family)
MLKVTERAGAARFEVHAKPRAKSSEVRGERNGVLDVALAAPPVDGAANEELVRFIASRMGIAKSRVTIARGQSSRNKLVEVAGVTAADVEALLK